jgi:uncharacterized protein
VHQDGLVHVSMLADKFVKDPNEVVKVGDIVKVKVLEIDIQRKRIQLTMRLSETPAPAAPRTAAGMSNRQKMNASSSPLGAETAMSSALMDAFKSKV